MLTEHWIEARSAVSLSIIPARGDGEVRNVSAVFDRY